MDRPDQRLHRRAFLRAAAAAAALPISFVYRRAAAAASPLGPLQRDPRGILDLPPGFSYRLLERARASMDDGYRVPGRPDGMGCFAGPDGHLVLMRNHENYPNQADHSPFKPGQAPPPEAYDRAAMGGVTRVVVRADTFERVSSNLVLAGTTRNCAGGASPWGWLSCEEDVTDRHGYVFVCPTDAASVQPPRRIAAYGRFYHEAAVVDPASAIAYLTEDREDGCLYRFLPDRPDTPFEGRLQALRVAGRDRLKTTSDLLVGQPVEVAWVDVPDPDPRADTVREQAQARGAALITRGEGMTLWGGAVYVCATAGGPVGGGQIFRYQPGRAGRPDTLELVAQSTDRDALDRPDNITFAPWGELFMAEDGPGETFLVVLDAKGHATRFARNALSHSELAGVCFSPDGRALFVNLQEDGLTLAITGPFPETRVDAHGGHSFEPHGFLAPSEKISQPPAPGANASRGCDCTVGDAGAESAMATLAGAAAAGAGLARWLRSRG